MWCLDGKWPGHMTAGAQPDRTPDQGSHGGHTKGALAATAPSSRMNLREPPIRAEPELPVHDLQALPPPVVAVLKAMTAFPHSLPFPARYPRGAPIPSRSMSPAESRRRDRPAAPHNTPTGGLWAQSRSPSSDGVTKPGQGPSEHVYREFLIRCKGRNQEEETVPITSPKTH